MRSFAIPIFIDPNTMRKLPVDFPFLNDMYSDEYFPRALVDKLADVIKEVASYLEAGPHSHEEVQAKLDRMTEKINELEKEFDENESELETVARESICETVEALLGFFGIDIDVEEAVRKREW